MFTNHFTTNSSNNWRESLKELKAARDQYNQYTNIMTPFERAIIEKSIVEQREKIEKSVLTGAITEWNNAIDHVKTSFEIVDLMKAKEVKRWNASEINSQRQMMEDRIKTELGRDDIGRAVKNLEGFFEDGMRGTVEQQRATCEVFRGLVKLLPKGNNPITHEVLSANGLATKANLKLKELRTMPDLDDAHKKAAEAVEGLEQARKTIQHADADLGYTKPNGEIGSFTLFQQLGRVGTDNEGNITFIENRNIENS